MHVKEESSQLTRSLSSRGPAQATTGCLKTRFSRRAARQWLEKGQCDNDANTATMLMGTTIRRLNHAQT